jgi:hypothetical protein
MEETPKATATETQRLGQRHNGTTVSHADASAPDGYLSSPFEGEAMFVRV